jgi:hypothetical protein
MSRLGFLLSLAGKCRIGQLLAVIEVIVFDSRYRKAYQELFSWSYSIQYCTLQSVQKPEFQSLNLAG